MLNHLFILEISLTWLGCVILILYHWIWLLVFYLGILASVFINSVNLLFSLFCHFIFFNWRIIALQNFVVFCHIPVRISHRYTHVPSLLSLPPISLPSHPSRWSQSPCLSSLSHTMAFFCVCVCCVPQILFSDYSNFIKWITIKLSIAFCFLD